MCFDFDALPPELPADLVLPPVAGGASAESLELVSADGSRLAAALAGAAGDLGVIILPDVRGLFRFYVELAERFALAGHPAIAIDYFGRTAGVEQRDADFDYMAHLPSVTPEQVQADVVAAQASLRTRTSATRIVTLGFCYGGAQSFLAGANDDLGLAGVVGFYGTLQPERIAMPFAMPSPLGADAVASRPVLGLFGGADEMIPAEDIATFGRRLDAAGTPNDLVTYPGAPHSFFDRSQEQFADASEDAWRRVLGFLSSLEASDERPTSAVG